MAPLVSEFETGDKDPPRRDPFTSETPGLTPGTD